MSKQELEQYQWSRELNRESPDCSNCKYFNLLASDTPCIKCNEYFSEWRIRKPNDPEHVAKVERVQGTQGEKGLTTKQVEIIRKKHKMKDKETKMKHGKISEEMKALMIVVIVFTLVSIGQNTRIESLETKNDCLQWQIDYQVKVQTSRYVTTNTEIADIKAQIASITSERRVTQLFMEADIADTKFDLERAIRAYNSNFNFLKEHLNELKKDNNLTMTAMMTYDGFEL